MRKVIAIGETVLDIIFKDEQPVAAKPGGSSFNALISLGRTGIPSTFISETGKDKVGDLIIRFLEQNNIETKYITRFENGKSALALAFLNENNDAEYEFYKTYPKERLQSGFPEVHSDDFILFGSYFAINPALRNQVKGLVNKANQNNAIVYYDPNFRSSHLHQLDAIKATIFENFSDATIIRGSDEDFYNILKSENTDEIYRQVCKNEQPLIYTMSSEGIKIILKDHTYRFPVQKLEPLSTIGAGDNFNAGFAYALFKYNINRNELKELDESMWKKITEIATSFSSEVCMSYDNYVSVDFANKINKIK
ncbi:PfkB family carbohydrate kinase [Saccharicrinis sp. FJH54]|uniref:PfkB family carbohydrate kinase n=1 Tax=Saccharicrinis sp. FJH54 TaxID=3344665 RepID=UPI0035D47EA8